MTMGTVHGIHHVTAIAGDPQENLDFYVGVLGLRLVKKSVNQDVTHTYHLFYADEKGTPGTDLTFFPWPDMGPARQGVGATVEVSFAAPKGSLPFWRARLTRAGVEVGADETRFGETVLPFRDPHGLPLALVETERERPFVVWADSPVASERQLRGFHSVRLLERDLEGTEALLTRLMGFEFVSEEGGWRRFAVHGGAPGEVVDVKADPAERRGTWGVGGVHHVAWRVRDDEEEMSLRAAVETVGLNPTPQIDRFWFRSVYFREPGGVLFELATDGPGFSRDEDPAHLGEELILPPWLEVQRKQIEAVLPKLRAPRVVA
jgi:glyoxalase family protein